MEVFSTVRPTLVCRSRGYTYLLLKHCHTNISGIYGWPDNDTRLCLLLALKKNPREESEL